MKKMVFVALIFTLAPSWAEPAAWTQLAAKFTAPKPDDDWQIDGYMLMAAQRALVPMPQVNSAKVASDFGFAIPVALFTDFRAQLYKAFRSRLKLPDAVAASLALRLEKIAAGNARVKFSDLVKNTGQDERPEAQVNLKAAGVFLYQHSTVDQSYDVPYLAGYKRGDPTYIFIDRDFKVKAKTKDGRDIPFVQFLTVHERIEKALLDAYHLTYQQAHQIALRSEQEICLANVITWDEYEGRVDPVIDQLEKKTPTRVHRDLDMTPYLAYHDAESLNLVAQMRAAMQ